MQLQFKENFRRHKSIKQVFPIPDLSDFNIITGINGSGKTQFLTAVEDNKIEIKINDEIVSSDEIKYFDYSTFKLKNQQAVAANYLENEKKNIFHELYKAQPFTKHQGSVHIPIIWMKLNQYFNTRENFFALQLIFNMIENEESLDSIELQDLSDPEFLEWRNLKNDWTDNYETYMEQIDKHRKDSQILMKYFNDDCLLSKISNEDILKGINAYQPPNFIDVGFGEIFRKAKEILEIYHNDEDLREETYSETYEKVQREHGQFPWLFMNQIFSSYEEGSFNFKYEALEPKERNIEELKPQIRNTETNENIEFSNLSSGEKVLLALTLFLFQADKNNSFPKVLLLDEIDATLHPTMCKNLLKTIKDNIVGNGTKIIYATHNPSIIANCDDNDTILIKNPNNIDKGDIKITTRQEALKVLSDGYITLDQGLNFINQIAEKELTIITEGKNTMFIEKFIELSANDYKGRIGLLSGIENISGKEQLKVLFDFLSNIPDHNKILFVWDCDANKYGTLEPKNSTFPFVFDKNEDNQLVNKGIENLFPNEYFKDFTNTTNLSTGQVKKVFNRNEKSKFMNQLFQNCNVSTFEKFSPLLDKIIKIID